MVRQDVLLKLIFPSPFCFSALGYRDLWSQAAYIPFVLERGTAVSTLQDAPDEWGFQPRGQRRPAEGCDNKTVIWMASKI